MIDSSTTFSGVNVLDSPIGLDTDGHKLYFCNYGTNANIYSFVIDTQTISILSSLPQGTNDGLIVYGTSIFVCSNNTNKVYKINILNGTNSVFETFTQKPNNIISVNNDLFITSQSSDIILTMEILSGFNSKFSLSYSSNALNYTLQNDFTINNTDTIWQEVGMFTDKIVIDGNNKTITIDDFNTDTLFFGGGSSSEKQLEIKNLNILCFTDILGGILRAYGYVKINNCNISITGNLKDNGGGLVYNNQIDIINANSTKQIEMINSTVKILGKIGTTAGSLFGYFTEGCNAVITDSFAMVIDPSYNSGSKTLSQSSGVLLGSGVGQNNNITINRCYCIFTGSMDYSTGIIAGKFLGSNGNITINNFYAITDIKSITPASDPIDNSKYPYFLSCYYGGLLFNVINATNVNILNFNVDFNSLNMYANNSSTTSSISGIQKFTNFNDFNASANSDSNKVGNITYFINYKDSSGDITSYKCYSPNDTAKYSVMIGSTIKYLYERSIVFSGPITKTYDDPAFNIIFSVEPSASVYFNSSDTSIATIDIDGLVTIKFYGTTQISVYTLCDDTYSKTEVTQTLTVNKSQSIIDLEDIGISNTAIDQIMSTTVNEGARVVSVPIDYNGLSEPDKAIARHGFLDIIFKNNTSTTNFVINKSNIGLNLYGATNDVNVLKSTSGLVVANNAVKETSTYVNIQQEGDSFTFNNNAKAYNITKTMGKYKMETDSSPPVYFNDSETVNIDKQYKIRFGGAFIYYSPESALIPCLTEDTTVLTPRGWTKINELKVNDEIITSKNRKVNIVSIYKSVFEGNEDTYPYVINKASLDSNYPPEKTLISGDHLIKYRNLWIHPKISGKFRKDKNKKLITYYHLETPNYETDYLIINKGLIVESFIRNNPQQEIIRKNRIKEYAFKTHGVIYLNL